MKKFSVEDVPGTSKFGGIVKFCIDKRLSDCFSAGTFMLRPGESLQPEFHEKDEFFYILRGVLTVKHPAEEEESVLKPGDVLFIPAGAVHHSMNLGDVDVEVLWCNGSSEI